MRLLPARQDEGDRHWIRRSASSRPHYGGQGEPQDPSEVPVTKNVTDLVSGSGITFEDRGFRDLKGIEGSWQVLLVASA